MKKFDRELTTLQQRLVEMANLTESMVALATRKLRDPARNGFGEVLKREDQLDQLQLDIDRAAIRLLTVYSPVAGDLRCVLTVSHVNTQLERIGDQAVNLCEYLQLLASKGHGTPVPKLRDMARLVSDMVHDAMAAYFEHDAAKAKATLGHDDLIDAMKDQITQELLSDDVAREVIAGSKDIAEAMGQILIARSLERIADHATNICEEVFYMVRGDDIRHRR